MQTLSGDKEPKLCVSSRSLTFAFDLIHSGDRLHLENRALIVVQLGDSWYIFVICGFPLWQTLALLANNFILP